MEPDSSLRPRTTYIEYLEKRIAPATFIVTNLDDAGAGSLRQAVLDANARPGLDTIVFRGAATVGEITLTSDEIDITDSVNIKGPGAGTVIIDAQIFFRIFNIDDGTAAVKNVTISGLSMVNGVGDEGGAIRSLESLTLINSVIAGSHASISGGAIHIDTNGKLLIRNSKLTDNTSEDRGGALFAAAEGGAQVLSSLVAENSSLGDGGGLYFVFDAGATGDILIDKSTIIRNSGDTGGGIWADNDRQVGGRAVGKITIRDTIISSNISSGFGGGVYLSGGNVLIERDQIVSNAAASGGGGISSETLESLTIRAAQIINNRTTGEINFGGGGIFTENDDRVLIQRTLISDNAALNNGGGIRADRSALTIQSSTITGNTATNGTGGGIRSFGAPLVLQSSTISGNFTTGNGGGIEAVYGNVTILNSTIRENQANFQGGGIANSGFVGTVFRITGSQISDNRAGDGGGGVLSVGEGRIDISNSRFLRNAAGINGGGLYLVNDIGAISVTNSVIMQNSSDDAGGGLAVQAAVGVSVTLNRTTVADNVTAGNGGGVNVVGDFGTYTFNNSTIRNNVASNQGGGLWTNPVVALNNTRITGNVASVGPQVYGPIA